MTKEKARSEDRDILGILRTVQCRPNKHKYINGVDGPPCPVCGAKEYEADP